MNIFIILVIGCYLLGSISGSVVLGKIKRIDIRRQGSGNAGATNAFRTVGPLFALGVMIIDVMKSFIPISLLSVIVIAPLSIPTFSVSETHLVLCGLAAVLGHVYPVFHQFKGGKGAGTLVGVILAIFPDYMHYILLLWIFILILTGYVGLSTIIAGISLVIVTYLYYPHGILSPFGYFTIGVALFLIFTHRSNIKRMLNGEENRFEKIMLFKKMFK